MTKNSASPAIQGAASTLTWVSTCLVVALVALFINTPFFGITAALTSLAVWATMASLIWRFREFHDYTHFGHANRVTTVRAVSTALLAGFIPVAIEVSSNAWLWAIAITATLTLCLDGLDGYLARKSKLCSAFGARFDMETDAFLALIITLFLWQSGKADIWVLGLGLMRYGFLGAAFWMSALRQPLYPSLRRKTVCVIQVGALCLMLCPWLSPLHATLVGTVALACLTYSFAVDVFWLFQTHATSAQDQQEQTRQAGE